MIVQGNNLYALFRDVYVPQSPVSLDFSAWEENVLQMDNSDRCPTM